MSRKVECSIAFIFGTLVAVVLCCLIPNKPKPYPQSFPILERNGYSVCYDGRNRIPLWTFELLTKENLDSSKPLIRNKCQFREDEDLPEIHRSLLSDFKNSGFDRGHLCPAGDLSYSEKALSETFYLSNICPQNPVLNKGLWKKLENHVRDLAKQGIDVLVYTGPLFLPKAGEDGKRFIQYDLIGESDVAVPTHFFKVMVAEVDNKIIEEAYIVPNKAINSIANIIEFSVSLDALEKVSGIIFIPKKRKF